MYIMTKLSK